MADTTDVRTSRQINREAVAGAVRHEGPTADRYQQAAHRYLSALAAPGTWEQHGMREAPVAREKPAERSTQSATGAAPRVADVMTTPVASAHEHATVKEVIDAFVRYGVAGVPVLADDRTVMGVVTVSDVLRVLVGDTGLPLTERLTRHLAHAQASGYRCRDIMTTPAVTTHADTTATEALQLSLHRRVRRLPVVDAQHRLIGIVTRSDLLKPYLRRDDEISRQIEREIVGPAAVTLAVDVSEGVVSLTGMAQSPAQLAQLSKRIKAVPGVIAVVR